MTDREIAFFFTYRQTEFMPESQEKVRTELKKRNLGNLQVMDLINQKVKISLDNCPRCQSSDFMQIKDTDLRSYGYGGYEVEINSRKCRICGYNAQKDKSLNWKVRLNKFLGKYNWTKLK
ncbi:hypothetical protein SAMN04488009_3534 [Maribacter sedimenticola]|uniref:YgiT-type zinc finger domain-containing protein n=2 Tax=Maribacter sedimenticola TaxID=228956 RepID=A0ABY1SL68_9FLAO|nr:hypothetical protein SAMN04488009_3534 [Maribacter sedimenticola]